MIERPVEHVGGLALGRADRQDAEIAVLVGDMAVEFGPWLLDSLIATGFGKLWSKGHSY